ncbi:Gfo/Idh/MocA family oxidoreductase [Botrimarina sp.]|uniref:Gfo/Idh/MocA family protein n=1 Tax=Botrimarina sp. TaxID=2795802 RepID=UPI0032EDA214
MNRIRLAVVGAGKLGGYHANLAARSNEFELVAVVDSHSAAAVALAERVGARACKDLSGVLDRVDAAVLATPTSTHAALGRTLLDAGKHVLVEKPIALTCLEADRLVDAAAREGVVLQVGHVERFSPALAAAGDTLHAPRYVQATRASGYTFRSIDIGVVLDLMIHDIDLVLSLARSPVVRVDALGVSVLGGHEDMANARLTFSNGCVADLTASRVSYQPERSMRVVTPRGFVALDFAAGAATTVAPTADVLAGRFDADAFSAEQKQQLFAGKLFDEVLVKQQRTAPAVNAIELELEDFANSIRTGQPPRVTGAAARDAVAVAERVLAAIAERSAAPAAARAA